MKNELQLFYKWFKEEFVDEEFDIYKKWALFIIKPLWFSRYCMLHLFIIPFFCLYLLTELLPYLLIKKLI